MWNDTDFCEKHHGIPAVNYLFALIFTVLLITSCICNPIVFWYQRFRSKQNVSSILYQFLTFFDFFTCLLTIPLFVYTFIIGHDPWCNTNGTVRTWQIVFTVAKMTVSSSSNIVTAVIGVMRAIVLNLPFYKVSLKLVLAVVGISITFVFIIIGSRVYTEELGWHQEIQCVVPVSFAEQPFTIGFILYMVTFFLNVLICGASAWMCHVGLVRAYREKVEKGLQTGNECHGCKTMIYLNLLVLVQFFFMLLCAFAPLVVQHCSLTKIIAEFLATPFASCLLSAMNPLIILVRSEAISKEVRSRLPWYKSSLESSSGVLVITQQTKSSV